MTTLRQFRRWFIAIVLVCSSLLSGDAVAQTTSTVADSSASPSPKQNLTNLLTASSKDRMLTIMQVPDTPRPVTLSDLLAEENSRLKKKIAALEKENAELKQKLNHP